ncbi:MAG TPA: D-arabinono-1,4-lactone oxidase [Acidimicrobiales bacterium]|nr:D-arabinono-1,4-lactone oxidase [Acidimicrobiales bacterium]
MTDSLASPPRTHAPRQRWRNWAGNQQCAPEVVAQPTTLDDVVTVVKAAAAEGRRVRAVGAGHSFTDAACTTGTMVELDGYARLLRYDREAGTATVQSGIPLARLSRELATRGLALPNLGDVAYQSISGAVSTGTHGTGIKLGGLATQIAGIELVTADGSVLTCSPTEEPEVFAVARVGLGAFGIISALTLQCVPGFHLRAVEEPMRVDHVLETLDELVEQNDHFEFYWVPHTGWALTKRNNRTDDPVGGRGRWKELRDRVLFENVVFGAICRVGRMRPEWIPRLARLAPGGGRSEYVEASWRVFTSPRLVHFVEMEYSLPRDQAVTAVERLRRFVEDSGLLISFPVEVRFTAADDIPLSTAYGGQRCYIAVHVYRGMQHEQYFRGVERIMWELGGRPHWGKLHYQSADTLDARYPEWDRFQAVRRRLDPEGRFANAYTDRVLGPVP